MTKLINKLVFQLSNSLVQNRTMVTLDGKTPATIFFKVWPQGTDENWRTSMDTCKLVCVTILWRNKTMTTLI